MPCQHLKIIYIGLKEGQCVKKIPLFNCLDCHSTITATKADYKFHKVDKYQDNEFSYTHKQLIIGEKNDSV